MTDAHPIVDFDTFNDLQSIMEDQLHDLLSQFIKDTPPVLININQAISTANFERIFTLSHSIVGSTGNLGISQLCILLQQITQAAKSENIEHCIQLGKKIDIAYLETKAVLLKIMKVL